MKKKIYEVMDKAFKSSKKSLRTLFSKVDANQSNELDLLEFTSMFEMMNLHFTKEEL
jgi:Ca2+-binding EF-hand superfamily protein